jgi:protein pelota
MSMIIHRFAKRAGLATITPEDEDDLWCLRRIIHEDDLVSSETSRVIKDKGEFSRPNKGERVNVSMTLQVERIRMDSSLGRLRITGRIVDTSEDFLGKGSSHSLVISADRRLTMKKEKWSDLEAQLLEGSLRREEGFTLVALDRREAAVGRVKGTHLQVYPAIDSGFSGKMYPEKTRPETSFFTKIEEFIASIHRPECKIFLTGPGTTKNIFARFLSNKRKEWFGKILIIDGTDVAGEDGVYIALRSKNLQKVLENGKLARVSSILEEVVRRISRDDKRVAVGFEEVNEAGRMGAVESLVISDRVFEHSFDETKLIELINKVEELNGRAYLVDSTTDLGGQVSSLGGIVALLRYPALSFNSVT